MSKKYPDSNLIKKCLDLAIWEFSTAKTKEKANNVYKKWIDLKNYPEFKEAVIKKKKQFNGKSNIK